MRKSLNKFLRGQPIDAPKGNLPHLPSNNLRSRHPPQNRKANLKENPPPHRIHLTKVHLKNLHLKVRNQLRIKRSPQRNRRCPLNPKDVKEPNQKDAGNLKDLKVEEAVEELVNR